MNTTTQAPETTEKTVDEMRREMRRVFDRACAILGITAKEVFLGHACHATFTTERAATDLAESLRLAGLTADVFRWGPDVDSDWTENEWQVSW